MNIRRFQPGEEFALFEVFYSAIHLIARNDYSEEQLNAWAPLDFDCELWVDRFGFVVVDRKKLLFVALSCETL
jgi:putative acetyltransferase